MKAPLILLALLLGGYPVLASAVPLSDIQKVRLGIRTSPLIADDAPAQNRYLGQVQFAPNSQQVLSKPYSLQITRWLVSLGDHLTKGQVMAEIYVPDMVNLEHEYHRLQSAVKLAKQKQTREQTLLQQGVVSQKQYQQSQSEWVQLLEQLDTVRNQLTLMGVSSAEFTLLDQDAHLNGRLTMTSPSAGSVTEILVGVNQSLPANTDLLTLITNPTLLVHIPVPPTLAQELRIGQALHLEDGTTATLQSIQQQLSSAQKMVVIANLQHPQLKAKQWVKVIFPSDTQTKQWRISRQSVTYLNNLPHVLVLHQGEVVALPIVLISATREGWIVQGEGLVADLAVIVAGTASAKAILVGSGE